MQLCLDKSEAFLRMQTPKEFVQQLATASEALRRSKLARLKSGGDGRALIEQFRQEFNGTGSDG